MDDQTDLREILGRNIAKYESIFSLFSHAITVCTWLSFCSVASAFLYRAVSFDLQNGTLNPQTKRLDGLGIVAITVAAASCLLLLFLFDRLVRNTIAEYAALSSGWTKWLAENYGSTFSSAFTLLVLTISGLLSAQLFSAFKLS